MDWTEMRLWVKDVGFPIVVALIAIYALYKMFLLREEAAALLKKNLQDHAQAVASISHNSNLALMSLGTKMDLNSQATKELTEQIRTKLDSDSIRKERQAMVDEVAAKFKCNAHEVEMLKEQARRTKLAEGGA